MENLNDVEFGSDNDGKEAPILVAQRYLNIFRQVHIFNKNKREEFDNELLALSPEITDFFKRMPGGRLLIEHIEKVKTERGISFVKANKEDFDEGAGKTDMPVSPQIADGAIVGGCLTIDPSFAEALAKAMAQAFKQNPTSVFSGKTIIPTFDIENAFNVIAEEIRSSRTALLDVLRETRSVTDSVIASQVSIARILESILSSRTKEDADLSDLNNRIIASQASITKLLEELCTSSHEKNTEISDYLNVENRLQSFRNEIKDELNSSLQAMQNMFKEYVQTVNDKKIVTDTSSLLDTFSESSFRQASSYGHKASELHSSQSKQVLNDYLPEDKNSSPQVSRSIEAAAPTAFAKNLSEENNVLSQDEQDIFTANDSMPHFEPVAQFAGESRKKRKKRKKHHGLANVVLPSVKGIVDHIAQSVKTDLDTNKAEAHLSQPAKETRTLNAPSATVTGMTKVVSQSQILHFDGIIRNQASKHNDDFNNVRLDEPPLDTLPEDDYTLPSAQEEQILPKNVSVTDNNTSSSTTDIPVENRDIENHLLQSLDSLDTLSFDDDVKNDQSESHSATIQSTVAPKTTVVDFVSGDDDLDFALPEVSDQSDDIANTQPPSLSFDDIQGNDAVMAEVSALPLSPEDILQQHQEMFSNASLPTTIMNAHELPETKKSSLDDFLNSADINNTAMEMHDTSVSDATEAEDISLVDFSNYQTENPIQSEDIESEQNLQEDTFDDLQQLLSSSGEENLASVLPTKVQGIEPVYPVTGKHFTDAASAVIDEIPQELISEANISQNAVSISDELERDVKGTIGYIADDKINGNIQPTVSDSTPRELVQEEKSSRYSVELDRIRAALTTDNIDISSLDNPIELDDYADDENVGQHDYADVTQAPISLSSTNTDTHIPVSSEMEISSPTDGTDEDWEWEYVDENGNEVPLNDDDWEWEYVEDDEPADKKPDNNQH